MPTPDYPLIDRLERELGIVHPPPKPERAVYPEPPVCLTNCDGDDYEIRNWTGLLMRRIHQH